MALGYVAVVVWIIWLRDRDPATLAVKVALLCVGALVVGLIARRTRERQLRRAVAEGFLDVAVRTPDNHPQLSRRWWRAELRLDSPVRLLPLAGPSASPIAVHLSDARVSENQLGWRDLFSAAGLGDRKVVALVDAHGTIEVAVPAAQVPLLLDGLGFSSRVQSRPE